MAESRPVHPRPGIPDRQLRTAWQLVSLLLDYPDRRLVDQGPLLREAIGVLPEPVGVPLARFVDHLEGTPLVDLQADYVETFDERRRCSLFLTYFAHGDTRKRGMALLRFKQAYLEAGAVPSEGELPDHLSVVLEFGATVDAATAWGLLLDHRAGVEVLRLALRDGGSPWAEVVAALSATLPRLKGDELEAVRRLAAQGPPEEEVGMTPYGTPAFDAALTPEGPVDLPMPAIPVRRGA